MFTFNVNIGAAWPFDRFILILRITDFKICISLRSLLRNCGDDNERNYFIKKEISKRNDKDMGWGDNSKEFFTRGKFDHCQVSWCL